jgi:voltage-gated potassium channel Kch
MSFLLSIASFAFIVWILSDAFETTVLPRRVTHRFRFARLYNHTIWRAWRGLALQLPRGKARESFLGMFGPLSMLGLLAIWVVGLIFGFALLHWSLGTAVHSPDEEVSFSTYLYWSGGTFFTLGYGDIVPRTVFGRMLAVTEAGMGFGFLALIISYVPVVYQTFSRRESLIALLDARAGSPPSAAQMLVRAGRAGDIAALNSFLAEWERWSAELLENNLSFPILVTYRSQHDNQSWLSSLTTMLDACAVIIAGVKDRSPFQAELTFAMSRHAVVDLALIFRIPPILPEPNRLPPVRFIQLYQLLEEAGYSLQDAAKFEAKLAELREMYEPFVYALGTVFLFGLPEIILDHTHADNWQRSAWQKRTPKLDELRQPSSGETHF